MAECQTELRFVFTQESRKRFDAWCGEAKAAIETLERLIENMPALEVDIDATA